MILLRPPDRLRSALAVARVTSLFAVVDGETQLSRCLGELPDHTDAHTVAFLTLAVSSPGGSPAHADQRVPGPDGLSTLC